jgi:hypothetical protein
MTYKDMFYRKDMMFIQAEHETIKEFWGMYLKAVFSNHELAGIIWDNIQDMKELIRILRGNYEHSREDTAVKKLFAWD